MKTAQTSVVRVAQKIALMLALAVVVYCFLSSEQKPTVAQTVDSGGFETVYPGGSDSKTGAAASECSTCHEQIATGFAKTVHGKVQNRASVSCESCHGNGAEHIAGGGDTSKIKNPAKINQSVASQTCMQCHSQVKAHAQWRGSKHEAAGLSCLSCHSVHHSQSAIPSRPFAFAEERRDPRIEGKLLRMKSEAETCLSCHTEVRKAQYQRSTHLFRNEDREQRMNCSSCHEPHGSIGPKMMRTASTAETCYQCHSEKRGPFLWEHAPVRENCSTCHKPHGSNHVALLQAKAPMLCQSCHIQGRHQTVAGLPNAAFATSRSCMNCHPAVHGSNHPSGINLQR
jgi:predicted CXXCH cytochrome family protein